MTKQHVTSLSISAPSIIYVFFFVPVMPLNGPPLPPRRPDSESDGENLVLSALKRRKLVEDLEEVRAFIDDNFDDDYVDKEENIERLDVILAMLVGRRNMEAARRNTNTKQRRWGAEAQRTSPPAWPASYTC